MRNFSVKCISNCTVKRTFKLIFVRSCLSITAYCWTQLAAGGRYTRGGTGQVNAQAEDEERIIGVLQKVLSGFIESNPTAWVPIIYK